MTDNIPSYTIVVSPLSDDDGGGFVARVPDLPGCIGDGATAEAAVKDAQRAVMEWISEYSRIGREVPGVGSAIEIARDRRARELKALTELRERVAQNEYELAGLDFRIDEIERGVQHLIELFENQDEWERFAVLVKTTRMSQKDFFMHLQS